MPNPADAGARFVPRAWAFDDRQPTGTDRMRRAGASGGGGRGWRGRERRGRVPRGVVLAAVDGEHPTRPVLAVAGQVAELLGGAVRPLHTDGDASAPRLTDACRGGGVGVLVLRVRPEVADLAAAVGKPVVAVPPHAAPVGVIRRVLVAWDGTPAMSASARQLAEAVLRAGREITAIPADTLVPALALARRSDLVVFGWSRRTSARHAGAVHAFLDSAPAPVALLTLPTRRWL